MSLFLEILGHFNHSPCFCHRQFLHLVTYLSFSVISKRWFVHFFWWSFLHGFDDWNKFPKHIPSKTLDFKGVFCLNNTTMNFRIRTSTQNNIEIFFSGKKKMESQLGNILSNKPKFFGVIGWYWRCYWSYPPWNWQRIYPWKSKVFF